MLLLSLWAVLSAGKVFLLDLDTVPLVPLEAARPVGRLGATFTNCTTPTDMASIVSLTLTPDPPEKGKALMVAVDINFKEEVTGGTAQITVKFGVITVLNKSYALCDIVKKEGKTCPIPAGDAKVQVTENIPSISGHFTGKMVAKDENGKELLCLEFDVHF